MVHFETRRGGKRVVRARPVLRTPLGRSTTVRYRRSCAADGLRSWLCWLWWLLQSLGLAPLARAAAAASDFAPVGEVGMGH